MLCMPLYRVVLEFCHVMQCIHVCISIPVAFSLYDHRQMDLRCFNMKFSYILPN